MDRLTTMTYEVDGRVARITLDRPARGNGITLQTPVELADCVERADLDPAVAVMVLAGNGTGFCGGYDLELWAEQGVRGGDEADVEVAHAVPGSPATRATVAANHDPDGTWDPVVDYQMMRRNVRGFMSLFHADKPVVVKVHGYCVAGGTDMALCSDLMIIAEDAKIGYPPARVWGSPTTSVWVHRIGVERAKRLLFTGDCLSGAEAVAWGLGVEAPSAAELDERVEALVGRIARLPVNQLVMMKRLTNQALLGSSLLGDQVLGTFLDGITRHTAEGHDFQRRAESDGFRAAVRDRDEPFGDVGRSTFKG